MADMNRSTGRPKTSMNSVHILVSRFARIRPSLIPIPRIFRRATRRPYPSAVLS